MERVQVSNLLIERVHTHPQYNNQITTIHVMMNEDDLLLRAKEERDEIFARYDNGRENADSINDWEEIEIYGQADT